MLSQLSFPSFDSLDSKGFETEVKLLLIFACPPGCSHLRLQNEERIIRECIRKSSKYLKVVIDVLPACTVEDLSTHLLQNRNQYNIIHYSGHADRVSLLIKHLYSNIIAEYGPLEESSSKQLLKELEMTADQLVEKIELHHHAKCTLLKSEPLKANDGPPSIAGQYHEPATNNLTDFSSFNIPSASFSQSIRFEDLPTSCNDIWSSQSNYTGSFAHSFSNLPTTPSFTQQSPKRRSTQFNLGIRAVNVNLKSGGSVKIALDSFQFSRRELLQLGVGSLVFESSKGSPSFVHPSIFADLLSQHQSQSLECVILNACGSRIQGDQLRDIAPLIVCFEGKISDDESLGFSRGFYSALCESLPLEECYKHGQSHMKLVSREPAQSPLLASSKGMINLLCSEKVTTPGSSEAQSPSRRHDPITAAFKQRVAHLEATNAALAQENERLKDMMSYGVEAMRRKDEEIDQLKQQLEALLPQLMNQNNVACEEQADLSSGDPDSSVTDNATPDSSAASPNVSSAWSLEQWLAQRRLLFQKPSGNSKASSPSSPKKTVFSRKAFTSGNKLKPSRRVGSVPQSASVTKKTNSAKSKIIRENKDGSDKVDSFKSDEMTENKQISQLERLSSFVIQSGHRLSVLSSSFYHRAASPKPESRIEELDELADQLVDVTITNGCDPSPSPSPSPSPMVSPRRAQNLTIRPRKSPARIMTGFTPEVQPDALDENVLPRQQLETELPYSSVGNITSSSAEKPKVAPKVSFSLSKPASPNPASERSRLADSGRVLNSSRHREDTAKTRLPRDLIAGPVAGSPSRPNTKSSSPFASSVPRFQN